MFDRGYLDHDRFCELEEREIDFICLLQADARVDVLDVFQDVEITGEPGTRNLRDEWVELAQTGERFRRIVSEDVDGEVPDYGVTRYAPVEVRNTMPLSGLQLNIPKRLTT